MGTNPFESFNTTPPAGQETPAPETRTENQTPTTTEQNTVVAPEAGTQTQGGTSAPPKTDEFIDNFNKRFSTTYKTDDEIKSLFELPKKVTEYEGKVKDRDELARSVEKYKTDLETLKKTEVSRYLSDPLMQRAYVANQLLKKHPDKDPFVLQEIAMTDVTKMSDLDVVAKERKVKYPSMPLENIKKVILHDLGIDASTPPEEWDGLAKDRLTMMAGDARENIKRLTEGIEIPKVEDPAKAEADMKEALLKKTELAKPIREAFTKTDKYNLREGLDYTLPEEFKEELGNIFDVYILKAGNEPTEENMKDLREIAESLFYRKYKEQIYDAMYKDAASKIQKAIDEEQGNTVLPNTATASDGATQAPQKPGAPQFLQDFHGQRRTTL